jgi:hypothetical protein
VNAFSPGGLRGADTAVVSQPNADTGFGRTILPRPLKPTRYVLDIAVVGEDDSPISGVAIELHKGATQLLSDRTGPGGVVRFASLEAGAYHVTLCDLDADAWELVSATPLPDAEATSSGDAEWLPSLPQDPWEPFRHSVVQGECISNLAARFGFSPETLWGHPENAALSALRNDRNVLNPLDSVFIPARRTKTVAVSTGYNHTVRRRGVPEIVRIRFLRDGRPRAGVPYLIAMTSSTGEPIADRSAVTDRDGFVVQSAPPSVTHVEVTLGRGEDREVHLFEVSHLDPIETVSGVQGRLNSLAYECGPVNNELNWMTRSAIVGFQIDHQLEPIGDPSEPGFRAALQKAYRS